MNDQTHSREPDTERKILEAAAKVFIQKGKLGSSMKDIADEAGINRTLLHYYFRNKENLFDTVFNKLFEQVFPAMVGIMGSDQPFIERMKGIIDAYSRLLAENPYLPVFIFQEISLNPERITDAIRGKGIDPQNAMHTLKTELEEAGMGGLDHRHIFASIMGMVLFPYIGRPLFQTIAFQGDPEAYDKFLDERTRHIPEFLEMAMLGASLKNNKS